MKTIFSIHLISLAAVCGLCQEQTEAPAAAAPSNTVGAASSQALAQGVIAEESESNFEAAIRAYQTAIEKFDSQRAAAANAVFRLAEAYRKLERMEEAKALYSRVVREFADQAELAKLSGEFLFGKPRKNVFIPVTVWPPASAATGAAASTYQTRLQQVVSRGSAVGSGISREVSSFKSQEELDLENQLSRAKAEALAAQRQMEENNTLYRAIREAKPEALPARAAADPRYQELKRSYQHDLLAGRDDFVTSDVKRMQTWVEKIYLPELKSELDFAQRRLDDAQTMAQVAKQTLEMHKMTQAQSKVEGERMVHSIREKVLHIEGAKEQWAHENNKSQGEIVPEDAVAVRISGGMPKQEGVVYSINPVGVSASATLTSDLYGLSAGTVIIPEGFRGTR